MTERVGVIGRRIRPLIVICLGLLLGCLMILSSTAFNSFAPVRIDSAVLYVVMAVSGAVIAFMYEEISQMALSALFSLVVSTACLGIVLTMSLRAVGWDLSVDLFLSMVGIHLVSYGFTTIIFQAAGAFVILITRRA